eukprot:6195413-Pleurochrysis_carterae.AAC.2
MSARWTDDAAMIDGLKRSILYSCARAHTRARRRSHTLPRSSGLIDYSQTDTRKRTCTHVCARSPIEKATGRRGSLVGAW